MGWVDGWIDAMSSIHGTNISTNENKAYVIVFFYVFLLYFLHKGAFWNGIIFSNYIILCTRVHLGMANNVA